MTRADTLAMVFGIMIGSILTLTITIVARLL